MRHIFVAIFALCTVAGAFAQSLKLSGGFTSNMVIQRDKPVRIFGTAPKDATVSVKFAGQKATAKADSTGYFIATLKPLKANAKGQVLTVTASTSSRNSKPSTLKLQNVLIGDVWLCGGQSNMEFNMGPKWRTNNSGKAIEPKKGSNTLLPDLYVNQQAAECALALEKGNKVRPLLRAIVVEKELKKDTLPTTGWKMIDGESIIPVSAVAYFFGKNLADSLQVPQGIIVTCWSGSRIEGWMNPEFSKADPTVNGLIQKNGKMDGESVGFRYNKMVRELAPMAVKGIIWYQGESNLDEGCWLNYDKKEASFYNGWRQAFKDDALSFYYVQLAPYAYSPRRDHVIANTWKDLPDMRVLQKLPQDKYPLTGMAYTTDLCDNTNDIHPTYKWEVGRRLARLALNKQFGRKDIVCDGPKCINVEKKGTEITVTFDQELTTSDGKQPRCFSVFNGRNWKPADAVIHGNKVTLSQPKLRGNLLQARYAWDELDVTNLCNKQGLPALPF